MSIDFREYFAGQCFGSMALSEEACNSELFGDEIDAELDEQLDEELFGAVAKRATRMDAFEKHIDRFKKMHTVGSQMNKRLSDSKDDKLSEKIKLDLKKVKSKMIKARRRLVAMWKKFDDSVKKEWRKRHNMHFNELLQKHGPHHFQAKKGSSSIVKLDKFASMSKSGRRSFLKGLSKEGKKKLLMQARKAKMSKLSKLSPEQKKNLFAKLKQKRMAGR